MEEMGLDQRPEEDERLSQEEKHCRQRAELEQGPVVERRSEKKLVETWRLKVGMANGRAMISCCW